MNIFPPTFMSAASLAFSGFLKVKSSLENHGAKKDGALPRVPDIFNPAVRFAVCSDIHNMNDRFKKMMRFCYEYSEKSAIYKKLDAVLVAGDFTGSGQYDEMKAFRDALNESVRPETTPVICIGNHEYFAYNRKGINEHGTTEDKFEELFGVSPDMSYNINGFTFLAASYDESGKHYHGSEKKKFYRDTLKKAAASAPEKPIFVIQHPHPLLTVYGSVYWGDKELNKIWRKYPNVVNFSGHSHYPMNDPRSIWQGGYTALGTGSLKYFELENELKCGFYGPIADSAEQFYIVEADEKGSVLVRCFDLYSDSSFGETYYIEKPSEPSSFAYTYLNRSKSDPAPRFPDSSFVSVSRNERGNYLLNFTAAVDRFAVHDYKVIIKDKYGRTVWSESTLSDYFLISRAPKYISVNLGFKLKKGNTYSVEIYACNCYYKLSAPLKAKIKVTE